MWLNPSFRSALDLDPARIRHGEVWRLVTYIFVPQTLSFWIVLVLWFLWFIGEGLERAWGAFRADPLFRRRDDWHDHRGILFRQQFLQWHADHFIVLRFRAILSRRSHLLSFYFARQNQMACMGFCRVLAAWICSEPNSYRAALIAAFANYFIFFGPEIIHQARHRHDVSARRRRFEDHSRSADDALHHCAACGATELTDPNLDFRVARDGEEYCMAHLPKAQTPG